MGENEIKTDVTEETQELKLSPPWVTYFKKVYNVLSVDPDINMPRSIADEGDGVYSFYIESPNASKICALAKVLKDEIVMGNITIKVEFKCTDDETVVARDGAEVTVADYEEAFKGNEYFVKVETIDTPFGAYNYAVFAREIITFFNDDTSDYHQNAHFIVADIIREIVNDSYVMPCTYFEEDEEVDEDATEEE